ncbi:hypothetical protein EOM39_05065, partial [Candidatus Gracilibacteria bacterium]|nr:hypothetical protein [Candidatus Gracilibacteria bacterium]
YIKPEVKPSALVIKNEEVDTNPVEPILNKAKERLSKKEYDEEIRKLKKQARDENWPRDKFIAEETRLTKIFEETKQARIEVNKNRPTEMERQKRKIDKMKKGD